MKISLVAALTRNHVIGKGNQTPWHMPADLRRFKELTMGKPIVMGRKTHQSIGRVLIGRQNIILSRSQDFKVHKASVVNSLQEAFALVKDAPDVMIIGGAEVFKDVLPIASALYLTWIEAHIAGDVYFPSFELSRWTAVREEKHAADNENPYPYTFTDYLLRS